MDLKDFQMEEFYKELQEVEKMLEGRDKEKGNISAQIEMKYKGKHSFHNKRQTQKISKNWKNKREEKTKLNLRKQDNFEQKLITLSIHEEMDDGRISRISSIHHNFSTFNKIDFDDLDTHEIKPITLQLIQEMRKRNAIYHYVEGEIEVRKRKDFEKIWMDYQKMKKICTAILKVKQ